MMRAPVASDCTRSTLAFSAGLALIACVSGTRPAGAGELIPAFGMTQSAEGSASRSFLGLSLRDELFPFVQGEVAVSHLKESTDADPASLRAWPVTASLLFAPRKRVYAGAGVGWYATTLVQPGATGTSDDSRSRLGAHAGGGFEVPLSNATALDVDGRYVMLHHSASELEPVQLKPDFWTMSLGLSLSF